MSPEVFYDRKLKGKGEEEIKTLIRKLKAEIGHLKKVMEHPYYDFRDNIEKSEELDILKKDREYLRLAIEELGRAGGVYTYSKHEQRALVFDQSIDFINKLVFSKGRYSEGYETWVYRIDGGHLYMSAENPTQQGIHEAGMVPDYPMTKEKFLHKLSQMKIGEWKTKYILEGYENIMCDGEHWKLTVYFSNGHKPFEFKGSSCYPYNFAQLEKLLGVTG